MKLIRSARVRMTLVISMLCAIVLGSFTLAIWWKLQTTRFVSLDKEMDSTGTNLALASRWELNMATAQARVREHFGRDRDAGWQLALTIKGQSPQLTQGWPSAIQPNSLPPSDEILSYDFSLPGPPRQQDGPKDRPPPAPDEARRPSSPNHDDRLPPKPGGGPRLYRATFQTIESDGKRWRVGTFGHAVSGTIIHLALDADVFAPDLNQTEHTILLSLPVALLLVAVGAWWSAHQTLKPVATLAKTMEGISLNEANQRLEAAGMDVEYTSIIQSYNTMLDRLERSYQQAIRFSADASHELKTPLAVMRGSVEQALHTSGDESNERRTYAGLLDELDHLQSIIDSLLLLSRADAGVLATSRTKLPFSSWLEPLMEDASLLAESHHITVHSSIEAGINVCADPFLITRAIHNLIRNAVAYNHEGGEIDCSLVRAKSMMEFRIANTGPPIAETERASIFHRFYRGANAGGTGQGKGMGIGLSLAREIFLAHGGSLELGECSRTTTEFVATLPLAEG